MANGTAPRRVESAEETYEQFGVLRQRVAGIEQSIGALAQQLAALSSKLDDRGRTPWAQLISGAALVVGIMTTIGMMAYWPIREGQTRFDLELAKLAERTATAIDRLAGKADTSMAEVRDDYVSIKAFDARDKVDGERRAQVLSSLTDRIERLSAQNEEIRKSIHDDVVPRVEHNKDAAAQRDRDADLQRQIGILQAMLTSLSSPADAMKDMRETIAELQRRVWALPAPGR